MGAKLSTDTLTEIINNNPKLKLLTIDSSVHADFLLNINRTNFEELTLQSAVTNTEILRGFNNPSLNLKSIYWVSRNKIDSSGFADFIGAIPGLEALNCAFNQLPFDDEQLLCFPQPGLTSLSVQQLDDNAQILTTADGWANFIGKNPNLENLMLFAGQSTAPVLQAISQCRNLKKLNLILDPSASSLSLLTNEKLKLLYLTNLTSDSGNELKSIIKKNVITNFSLWNCQLTSEDLVLAILSAPNFVSIGLYNVNLTKEGMFAILEQNLSLSSFGVSSNQLTEEDFEAAKKAFPTVYIKGNPI